MMFAVTDIETTGGSPRHDRIIEIAVVKHNGKRVIEEFTTLVNPGTHIAPFITAMTGITNEMVEDAPAFDEISDKLFDFTKDCIFVAHNARFDYGFIRNEFKRLNRPFFRRQLCTVKVGRKLLPGLRSYSLGRLCSELGIPHLNRHRAFGDAEATAQLLQYLMFNDRGELIPKLLREELEQTILPAGISRSLVDNLPEETGVYYFHGHKGRIIYIGKSNNIRKRVLSHFSCDLKHQKYVQMKNRIEDITYELTGSELPALLLESHQIKRFMPEFNTAQKIKKYRFGIYHYINDDGDSELIVKTINGAHEPVKKFTTRRNADKFLLNFIESGELNGLLCHTTTRSNWETITVSIDEHNRFVDKLLKEQEYVMPHFAFIGEGRSFNEQSVVLVENNQYKGFGYFDTTFPPSGIEGIRDCIASRPEDPDIKKLINTWLRKKKKGRLVPLKVEEVFG